MLPNGSLGVPSICGDMVPHRRAKGMYDSVILEVSERIIIVFAGSRRINIEVEKNKIEKKNLLSVDL